MVRKKTGILQQLFFKINYALADRYKIRVYKRKNNSHIEIYQSVLGYIYTDIFILNHRFIS